LPQNSVTAIAQTRDGYLWLGTFGGLARFDGVKFTVFDTTNAPGLRSSRIVTLCEARDGSLWVGTEQGGLTRYAQGTFTSFTTRDGLPDNLIWSIAEGQQNDLWIGTNNGVARLKDGRFTALPIDDALSDRAVRYLLQARDGSLWMQTDHGLARHQQGRLTTYMVPAGVPAAQALNMREGRDGSVWVVNEYGIFRFYQGAFTTVARYPRRISDPSSGLIIRSFADRQGNTCFITPDGLFRFTGEKLIPFGQADAFVSLTKGIAPVRCVLEDREGNLWVGTDGAGVHRLKEAQLTAYAAADGLSDESFVPITGAGQNGLWLGSITDGLFRFSDGRFTRYPSDVLPWSLHQDRHGALWIGSSGELRQLKDGRLTRFDQSNSVLAEGPVRALHEDRDGSLWIGTGTGGGRGGLYHLRNGAMTAYRVEHGLVHNEVLFITQDRQQALWIGTVGGLSRFRDGRFTNYTTRDGLSSDMIRAIYEDADGALWIGTYGGGLNRFKEGRFTPITTLDGLFDNIVSRILEDDRGHFWMSGNRGLSRVSRRELNDFADGKITSVTSVAYGVVDGMRTSECNGGGQPAGWKDRDGQLWFPTISGVVVVDPNKINPLPPVVHIEQLSVNKTVVALGREIRLPPGKHDLEIHYTGLSLVAPEKVRFKYKLEGYDSAWIDAGARRVAYYTSIPPGAYRFRVIASNNDGVWNETGAVVAFSLAPYFYQTAWFYLLAGAALVLLGVSLNWLRVKQLARRNQELATKVIERTAEVVEQKNQLATTNDQLMRANDQLASANEQLARAHDDLLSIFNQWRSGVMTTDQHGQVTFLSHTAERLFGQSQRQAVGQPWERVIPLPEAETAPLKRLLECPPQQRSKSTVHVRGPEGHRYWMEVDVQDDPRDPRRKIFFLYDVSEVYDLRQLLDERARFHDLVGQSAAMQVVYRQIRDVARVDTTVLIVGETGTGKELAAGAIHYFSQRKGKPFVPVNCAGLSESLVASQLFGHKRGAFTGAVADQIGLFEAAHGGTLFLDEVGDIPLNAQTSLLRVLQEKEITRVGETRPRLIDVRVVAATHRDLDQEVAAGRFRQDLLYRIRVTQIKLPPLRERREDIPLLVAWFLSQFRAQAETPAQEVSQEAMQALMSYHWPGNVRELKSTIESAAIWCQGPVIQVDDLAAEIFPGGASLAAPSSAVNTSEPRTKDQEPNATWIDPRQRKKQQLLQVLERTHGNRAATARELGVSRTTLYQWLKDLGIE
jgi:PAS domain S-box-containing protein